jgi:hypothetical protein
LYTDECVENFDENWAREWFELFMFGNKHHNENDVKGLSKAVNPGCCATYKAKYQQDGGKWWHSQGVVMDNTKTHCIESEQDIDDMVDMMLAHSDTGKPATAAKWLCRNVFQYFAQVELDMKSSPNLNACGKAVVDANYEVSAAVKYVLQSKIFFDKLGNKVASPLHVVFGAAKDLNLEIADWQAQEVLKQVDRLPYGYPDVSGWNNSILSATTLEGLHKFFKEHGMNKFQEWPRDDFESKAAFVQSSAGDFTSAHYLQGNRRLARRNRRSRFRGRGRREPQSEEEGSGSGSQDATGTEQSENSGSDGTESAGSAGSDQGSEGGSEQGSGSWQGSEQESGSWQGSEADSEQGSGSWQGSEGENSWQGTEDDGASQGSEEKPDDTTTNAPTTETPSTSAPTPAPITVAPTTTEATSLTAAPTTTTEATTTEATTAAPSTTLVTSTTSTTPNPVASETYAYHFKFCPSNFVEVSGEEGRGEVTLTQLFPNGEGSFNTWQSALQHEIDNPCQFVC